MRCTPMCLLFALFAGGVACAGEVVIDIPAGTAKVGVTVEVPEGAAILEVTATSNNAAPIALYLKQGAGFSPGTSLAEQADYTSFGVESAASLAIGTYAEPALHAGTWQLALANAGSLDTTVTLTTAISHSAKVASQFVASFDAPSAAFEAAWNGALACDVAPWHDATAADNGSGATLGEVRRSRLNGVLDKLAIQVHSPVPVHVQACWKDFPDAFPSDGDFVWAAASGSYIFHDQPGFPEADTWYAMAPAERLSGRRMCQYYQLACSIPDIIVWYNRAALRDSTPAYRTYVRPDAAAAVRFATLHELVHGLGFISLVDLHPQDADGQPNADFLQLREDAEGNALVDAFTANVAYLHPGQGGQSEVTAFADLSVEQRQAALTSGHGLVWNDPELAASPANALHDLAPPDNLVQLYAPDTIDPYLTLSHLNGEVYPGQLMMPTRSGLLYGPRGLGMACDMLAKVGWRAGPEPEYCGRAVLTGTWFDPAHSGHGIDLELVGHDPAGDIYSMLFYTFDAEGQPEYYGAALRLANGRLGALGDPSRGADLARPVYDPQSHGPSFPDGASGRVSIEFAGAVDAPACQGHEREPMALMHWSIGSDSATWCISPTIGMVEQPVPREEDLNGVWSAGSGDSGWGLSLTELMIDGSRQAVSLLYYYDDDKQPRWGITRLGDYTSGETVDVHESLGYCRTCAKAPLTTFKIGTMTLDLHYPEHVELPSGDNGVSVDINAHQRAFQRHDSAMRLLSLPATL